MAFTPKEEQQIKTDLDLLFKSLFAGKAATNTNNTFFEEAFNFQKAILPSQILADESLIPTTATAVPNVIELIQDLVMLPVAGSPNAFYHPDLVSSLAFNFGDGSSYLQHLKKADNSIIPFGQNRWVFNPSAGVLWFRDGNPTGVSPSNPPKMTTYKYIGAKGVSPSTLDEYYNSVLSIETDPASLSPNPNDQYLIGNGAIGIWAGKAGQIARLINVNYAYTQPTDGATIKVDNEDDKVYHHEGAYIAGAFSWVTYTMNTVRIANATGTNNYDATISPPLETRNSAVLIVALFANANTGAVQFSHNGSGLAAVHKNDGTGIFVDLEAGDIIPGVFYFLWWDGLQYQFHTNSTATATNDSNYTFVDDTLGNDATGIRNNAAYPFKTPKAAQDATQAGDQIFVKTGMYLTNNTGLGKNGVDWYFQFGAWLKPADTAIMWTDSGASYNVYGAGHFGDPNTATSNTYLIHFSDPSSTIHFNCRYIEHKSNVSLVALTGGGHKTINCLEDIINYNTNDLGSSLYISGHGFYTVNAKHINTYVGGLSFFSSQNGNCLHSVGFSGAASINADLRKFTTGNASVVYSRTSTTGKVYINGAIASTVYSAAVFFRAGILHQGGYIVHHGSIEIVNSPAIYSNNAGAVNFFHHRSGSYKSTTHEAIRLHDTGAKGYQFDGEYQTDAAVNVLEVSGNITGTRVDVGKANPTLFHNKNTNGATVKAGIKLTAAYTLFIGSAKIICDDLLNGEAITAATALTIQIDHDLVSNVDKNSNVTAIIPNKFNFNTAIAV